MLEAAGKRVHVYTSPHLVRFHERIELAGADGKARPIGEDELVDVLTRTQARQRRRRHHLFRDHHRRRLPGLRRASRRRADPGGRPRRPARRHQRRRAPGAQRHHADLARSRRQARRHARRRSPREKAGILKRGVPAVISAAAAGGARTSSAPRRRGVGAPLIVWGEDFEAFEQRGRLVCQSEERLLDLPLPALIGPPPDRQRRHRRRRRPAAGSRPAALASTSAPSSGASRRCAGRRACSGSTTGPLPSLLKPGSELWLDGGHNPAGGRAIAQTLADLEERAPKPLHLIVGMMGQKDAGGFPVAPSAASCAASSPCPSPARTRRRTHPETLAETAARSASRPRAPPTSRRR